MELNYLAIVLSILIYLVRRFMSKISAFLVAKFVSFQTNELKDLRDELAKLKRERDSFNPIDEFAKYALTDRKINKLVDKMKSSKSELSSQRMKKIMYCNGFLVACMVIMSITLMWFNSAHPVVNFADENNSIPSDEESIFYPLNGFLSLPSKHEVNSIGVFTWIFIINRFLDIVVNKCRSPQITKEKISTD
jgi:hypothetical protein